jgi:DNA-binding response OmpR family regulator
MVLLVDDERAIAQPIAAYLGQRGWITDIACEPEEAEALAMHRRYDLAILDLCLTPWGGSEGLAVLRELRERCPGAVIIVLSAYVSAEADEEARRCGADAILRKPQSLPELARLAESLMDDPRA